MDVQKLFGYLGLFTLVALWWIGNILFPFSKLISQKYTNSKNIITFWKFLNCACRSWLVFVKELSLLCLYFSLAINRTRHRAKVFNAPLS